ncbi:MAG: CHAT domain-containing protein [Prevotellaceae bacterium]|nr:CHAT domain-containing protein [Prevotellaceae bacterium]
MIYRLTALLFSLLLCLIPCRAENAMQLILAHRQWMSQHYPKAEDLTEEELLKEAAFAISDELREPEARALLVATSRIVPELNDYVTWLDSGEPDLLFHASITALKAVADAAESRLGRLSETTGWCRFLALDCISQMQNVTEQAGELIKTLEEAVSKKPTREARALLCIVRLEMASYMQWEQFVDDPRYYDTLLTTEKEVLQLYPLDDEEVSRTRAYLYYVTGKAIAGMSFAAESIEARERLGTNSETQYQSLAGGMVSNAYDYFEKSLDLYSELFTEGHPEKIAVDNERLSFLVNNFPAEEENIDAADLLKQYMEAYYPKGSVAQMETRLGLWTSKLTAGESLFDAIAAPQLVSDLKECLGEGSYAYINSVTLCILIYANAYPQRATDLLEYVDDLFERLYDNEPLKRAFLLNSLYSYLVNILPERAAQETELAYNLYRLNHNASPLSLSLGRRITEDNYFQKGNLKLAAEAQEAVCADAKALYGDTSTVYLTERKNLIAITPDPDTPATLYPELIAEMKACGKDFCGVLSDYADYAYAAGDYKLAEKLSRQLVEGINDDTPLSDRALYLLQLNSTLGKTGGRQQEREELFNQALDCLNADTDTLNFLVGNYQLAAGYLSETGRFEEAVEMLDRGMEVNDILSGGQFDKQFSDMLLAKANILYNALDDKVNAQRILSGQLSLIDLDSPANQTPEMLGFLWNCYYLISGSSNNDFTQTSRYLTTISQMTQSLYAQSGYSELFLMSYVVQALAECFEISATLTRLHDDLETENPVMLASMQSSEVIDFAEGSSDIIEAINQSFRNNEQYRKMDSYSTWLQSLGHYYFFVKQDIPTAQHYMEMYCEAMEGASALSFINAQVELCDFYCSQGKNQQGRKALDTAYRKLMELPSPPAGTRLLILVRILNFYREQGNRQEQLKYARLCYICLKEIMDGNFQLMTEREQNNFLDTYNDPAALLAELLEYMPEELAGEVYDAVLYRTGMQLRSQVRTKQLIASSGDKELIAMADSLSLLQAQMRSLPMETEDFSDTGKGKQLSDLQFKLNTLEQRLLQATEQYRQEDLADVTWQQIRDKLSPDEAAIEFVGSANYVMALVLRSDSKAPSAVRLIRTDSLMLSLQSLGAKKSEQLAMMLYNDRALDLYSMLWQPIEERLDGVKTVYLATSGVLNSLAFAAFSLPEDGYLSDKYTLCQLTTTAKILHPSEERQPSSALLMGDMYYSDTQALLAANGEAGTRGLEESLAIDDFSDSRGAKRDHFPYLSNTGAEVKSIASEMEGQKQLKGHITLRTGSEASEDTFRQLSASSPDVIHLATHGFYLSNDVDLTGIPYYSNNMQNSYLAMRRAGVAFSNAESAWRGESSEEDKDGILTADEVGRLNLHGTQLVVLSACVTALGNYSFEGVFGLPRGFKQAGVGSMLVSLWSVSDKSTSLLMQEFYRSWLSGNTKRAALQEAVSKVRSQYPEPYYWAPFVLME